MIFLDLFAGVGGMSLGLERAGMTCAGHVEIDPFCRSILQKHWPNVPLLGDIREVKGDEFGPLEMVCGGPPCQPVSVAGKRRGSKDDRWLWGEVLRLVSVIRPAWCLFENPPGIVNLGLDGILAALEGDGYACRVFEIPACAVNAPHIRQRVWILGYCASHARREQHRVGETGHLAHRPGSRCGTGQPGASQSARYEAGPQPERLGGGIVAHSLGAGLEERHGIGGNEAAQQPPAERTVGSNWDDAEWLPCWDGKLRRTKPGLRLLVDGVPDRVARLKALGNAVVPQVVEVIGRATLEAEILHAMD